MSISLVRLLLENTDGTQINFQGQRGSGILPIALDTKHILVQFRSADVDEPHTYGTVGGIIKQSENPANGAVREFEEETGYTDTDRLLLVPVYIFKKKNFAYHNFIGIVPKQFDVKPKPAFEWETDFFVWAPLDELLSSQTLHPGLEKLLTDNRSLQVIKKVMLLSSP